jgi:2-polyprenyl-6-methoxyphenol hydroxylase-like FAD-dependent oxidoreductase
MATVLVSGASVAGTTLAYWLGRHGFTVTVVEHSQGLRLGGQAVDVRGPAREVIDRMGLLEAVAAQKTAIRGMSIVDAEGNEIMRDTESTLTGGVIDNPDIEILRDDLIRLLCDATAGAEYLYGDSIAALDERHDSMLVSFDKGPRRAFDLVIGADGQHSNVRRLAFGPEAQFTKRMGRYMAICTVANFLDLDHWQMWHRDEKTMSMAGVYSARDNTEARALLGFTDPELQVDYRDVDAQHREVRRHFSSAGWVVPHLVAAMCEAPDFYFDEMVQIIMESWSKGRVGLVGDAAYCCSPLSGQGTSVALIGAYVLAGELAAASGNETADYRQGFASYEAQLRDYILANQSLAFDEDTGDEPIAPQVRHDIINSFSLKDYKNLLKDNSGGRPPPAAGGAASRPPQERGRSSSDSETYP